MGEALSRGITKKADLGERVVYDAKCTHLSESTVNARSTTAGSPNAGHTAVGIDTLLPQ